MSDISEHLTRIPLFQGMTEPARDAIAAVASETHFADGQGLTHEGEPGDAFFVIVEGALRVTHDGALLRELGPGDFLGEIALVDGRPRTATARAVGPVKAIVIRRPDFLELIDRHPAVRLGVLMALTERIRGDEEDILD